jgi:hypothetical protein
MPDPRPDSDDRTASVGESLCWRSWPVVNEWPRSAVKSGVLVVVCVAAGMAFGGVGYGLLAAAMLTLALARYFFPTRFVLDEAGVSCRMLGSTGRLAWSQVRRVVVQRAGVFLSPLPRPSRLDSFRGVFLRFAGNAGEVTEFVGRKTNMVA